ncbi:MAG TPA: SH2 domain-containing protein, partial [Myxococcota bacterium]|nr:SH2 domain-containing protein [Myxococcota bacterium]
MPPIDFPRIHRLDANALLVTRPFVLRRGRGQRLVLTVRSDAGRPMHLRVRYDSRSDTYRIRPAGWLDGTLYKMHIVYNERIPAGELVHVLRSLLSPAVPEPLRLQAAPGRGLAVAEDVPP